MPEPLLFPFPNPATPDLGCLVRRKHGLQTEPFNVHVEFQPSIDLPQLRQHGKAPAFIGAIWANIVPENELPDTPVYDPPEFDWFGGQMLKPDTSGHPVVTRPGVVILV